MQAWQSAEPIRARPGAVRLGDASLTAGWLHFASWLALAVVFAYALSHTANVNGNGAYVTTGGLYSATDGLWAEWNAISIMRFGQFLDPSPFNAFSGMGSTYLPNLPWLNPGALMLALPFERHELLALSYLAYMVEVGAALTILARTIGFSWAIATAAAQLHILLLFPPFSAYFGPLEWYSAAPMYAHLTSVWCFTFAAFMACGRKSAVANAAAAVGVGALVLAGDLSSPFSFIFFAAPFATLGLVLILARPPSLRELVWKAGAVAMTILAAHLAGFTDYLLATAATSARTPLGPIEWGQILSPAIWFDWITNHSLCATDARALMCRNDPLWWLQALALAGSLILIFTARGGPRAAGIWGVIYIAGLHLYSYPYQAGVLGPVSTLSPHFLSWSAYAILPVLAVAAIAGVRRVLGRLVTAGVLVTKVTVPSLLVEREGIGPIIQTLASEAAMSLDRPFRGYAATYWSPALDSADQSGMAARVPVYRYIAARSYFFTRYGTSFTETDLWRAGVPTFEEYGQWVSRQSQLLVKGLLNETGKPTAMRFLRLYKLDIDIMRALGIRFLITDLELDGEPSLRLRAEQSAPGALSVRLYETTGANLATYSPTRAIRVQGNAKAITARMAQAADRLDADVFVGELVQGPFVPARQASMLLQRDGYRVTAKADGRALLLLPIQFSHCLKVTDHTGGGIAPRLYRANLVETLVLFEGRLDATIEFDFGLFGNAACRLQDGREVKALAGSRP